MKKIFLILIIALIIIILGNIFVWKKEPAEQQNTDAIETNEEKPDNLKFKEEYESLNDSKEDLVFMDEDNPIKYVSISDTLELLKSDKAIIYVGANWCPHCRKLISPMFKAAKELGIDTIYYLNFDNEKSQFEIKDSEVEKTKEGSEDYYKLLKELDPYLKDYELTDSDGNKKTTGEKRIYMPTLITVKDGNILDAKTITASESAEASNELYNICYEMFSGGNND